MCNEHFLLAFLSCPPCPLPSLHHPCADSSEVTLLTSSRRWHNYVRFSSTIISSAAALPRWVVNIHYVAVLLSLFVSCLLSCNILILVSSLIKFKPVKSESFKLEPEGNNKSLPEPCEIHCRPICDCSCESCINLQKQRA